MCFECPYGIYLEVYPRHVDFVGAVYVWLIRGMLVMEKIFKLYAQMSNRLSTVEFQISCFKGAELKVVFGEYCPNYC